MAIEMRPVVVDTGSEDVDGRTVFRDGRLAGVLVLLCAPRELRGRWFVEAAFGRWRTGADMTFATLDEATAWFDGERGGPPPGGLRET